jgi:hypothetical protein
MAEGLPRLSFLTLAYAKAPWKNVRLTLIDETSSRRGTDT